MKGFYQKMIMPIGMLYLATDGERLNIVAIGEAHWQRLNKSLENIEQQPHPLLAETKRQLTEYFSHQRTNFDLPLGLYGTPFQQSVWQVLLKIPYGEQWSYSQQAQMLGKPQAARAVGHANGLNPLSIIVPCHRVISKSGALGGYAGGVTKKRDLLDLEKLSLNG